MSRSLPFLVLAATGGIVFAQQDVTPMASVIDPWIQGGSFVVLGYVVFHLLKFTVPSLQKQIDDRREEFGKESAEQRKDFRETLDAMSARHERWETSRHEDSVVLNGTLSQLSRTCTRVHHLIQQEEEKV